MSTARGFAALFVAFRSAPQRGVTILTVDIPDPDGQAAMDYLGEQVPGQSKWVGVVRTDIPGSQPIPATYESCRTVNSRKALALNLELPIEQQHRMSQVLGVPMTGKPIPVVVALLANPPAAAPVPRKEPGVLAVQQAALVVKDARFQRWILGDAFSEGDKAGNETNAVADVRVRTGVVSRSEYRTNPEALARFHELMDSFERHLQSGSMPQGRIA